MNAAVHRAGEHGLIRMIDKSGENYPYPAEYFVTIALREAVEKALNYPYLSVLLQPRSGNKE
jgi:hypothetical protein